MPLLKLPISIGTDCWICADAFIGPGLTIGDHSIVAARAVVVKPVPPGTIIGGNPARQIGRSHTGTSDIQEPSKNGSPTP
jgi:putative colanic acid biosynthesis acetyltransferase WcaF